MNIITDSKAYCLFPHLTLDMRTSVLIGDHSSNNHRNAIEKYINRGYNMLQLGRDSATMQKLLGTRVVRRLGDSRCWTIDVSSPSLDDIVPCGSSALEANTFMVEPDIPEWIEGRFRLRFSYDNVLGRGLQRGHVVYSPFEGYCSPSKEKILRRLLRIRSSRLEEYVFISFCLVSWLIFFSF